MKQCCKGGRHRLGTQQILTPMLPSQISMSLPYQGNQCQSVHILSLVFIEVELIYKVMLVSGVQQSYAISYIYIYIHKYILFHIIFVMIYCCCCCKVTSVVSDSVQPQRWQPTRLPRPWDTPGKNTGVGCHFLLQCMKVKSESQVTQSGPTFSDPMDCSPPGSSVHGILQARGLEWVPLQDIKCHSLVCIYFKNRSTSVTKV